MDNMRQQTAVWATVDADSDCIEYENMASHTPPRQCPNGTQISVSQVTVVAGGGAKEVRFLFFLPPPMGPLLGS